jgi:uncharacterized protein YecT (DUF1311 family)
MKKRWLLGLMLAASIPAFAADQTSTQELAARSQLPLRDVQPMLANCDLGDQSTQGIYYCAWRDLIAAERDLQKIVDQRSNRLPERKAALNARIAHWKKARDANCKKIAHHDWAGGSEEPVAAMICRAADAQGMVKAMKKDHTAVPCKNAVRVCHDDPISQ